MVEKEKKISAIYLIVILAILGTFLGVFILVANEMRENKLVKFDQTIIHYVQGFISPKLTEIMLFFTFLGSVRWLIIAVILATLILFLLKKRALGTFVLLSSGIGSLFNSLLKHIFKRTRPDIKPLITEMGFSFPSGHSMGSFIFYGAIAYILIHYYHRKWRKITGATLMFVLIFLIGLSRIYLGVHFPSDIIGGFTAGGAWLVCCIIMFRYYEYKKGL